ncbi:unnamed protein product [Effrenium voratum]|uniref:Uncharacterized protein n=1 Tax=Effrenium voratum TaxID=2562239 RepID=A0AA36NGQ1_9DINO|nr:unnamed protein product [Effrenium voratum]
MKLFRQFTSSADKVATQLTAKSHSYTFQNTLDRQIKVLLEEDPEGMLQAAQDDLNTGIPVVGKRMEEHKRKVLKRYRTILETAKPFQEFSVLSEQLRTVTMRSPMVRLTVGIYEPGGVLKVVTVKTKLTTSSLAFTVNEGLARGGGKKVRADSLEEALHSFGMDVGFKKEELLADIEEDEGGTTPRSLKQGESPKSARPETQEQARLLEASTSAEYSQTNEDEWQQLLQQPPPEKRTQQATSAALSQGELQADAQGWQEPVPWQQKLEEYRRQREESSVKFDQSPERWQAPQSPQWGSAMQPKPEQAGQGAKRQPMKWHTPQHMPQSQEAQKPAPPAEEQAHTPMKWHTPQWGQSMLQQPESPAGAAGKFQHTKWHMTQQQSLQSVPAQAEPARPSGEPAQPTRWHATQRSEAQQQGQEPHPSQSGKFQPMKWHMPSHKSPQSMPAEPAQPAGEQAQPTRWHTPQRSEAQQQGQEPHPSQSGKFQSMKWHMPSQKSPRSVPAQAESAQPAAEPAQPTRWHAPQRSEEQQHGQEPQGKFQPMKGHMPPQQSPQSVPAQAEPAQPAGEQAQPTGWQTPQQSEAQQHGQEPQGKFQPMKGRMPPQQSPQSVPAQAEPAQPAGEQAQPTGWQTPQRSEALQQHGQEPQGKFQPMKGRMPPQQSLQSVPAEFAQPAGEQAQPTKWHMPQRSEAQQQGQEPHPSQSGKFQSMKWHMPSQKSPRSVPAQAESAQPAAEPAQPKRREAQQQGQEPHPSQSGKFQPMKWHMPQQRSPTHAPTHTLTSRTKAATEQLEDFQQELTKDQQDCRRPKSAPRIRGGAGAIPAGFVPAEGEVEVFSSSLQRWLPGSLLGLSAGEGGVPPGSVLVVYEAAPKQFTQKVLAPRNFDTLRCPA